MGLLALPLTSACGNLVDDYTFVGQAGVQVDAAGHLSVVVLTCGTPMTRIVVTADRTGLSETQENPTLATYRTRRPSTEVSLDLTAPGPSWTPRTTFDLPRDRGVILAAQGDDEDTETTSVHLAAGASRTLRNGPVYVSDDANDALTPLSGRAFAQRTQEACDR